MSAEVQPPDAAPLPKYSRYRSVRQAAAAQSPTSNSSPEQKEEKQDTQKTQNVALKKSMSRYRRPRMASTELGGPPTLPVPPLYQARGRSLGSESDMRAQDDSQEEKSKLRTGGEVGMRRNVDGRGSPNEGLEAVEGSRQYPNIRAGNKRREEAVRQADPPEYRRAPELSREEEARMMLEKQKRKDLERLEAELTAAAAVKPAAAGISSPAIITPSAEKFTLFSRKRALSKAAAAKSPGLDSPKHTSNEPHVPIVHGGNAPLPGADAPISAVNAGERRVLVRCKQSSINLPVTPETTPVDISHSAANILSHGVTPAAAILLESYTQLGLERRIRRYEHIRDIMNSWDRDTQNAILLQASDSPGYDHDLDASSVPKERPGDTVVYMYHSQKPGKWNKRYITLLSSGQVFICKRSGAKITEKDVMSICHLSDFDIYTPTQQQLRRNLRPPKKHCHAIKSQQKTTMFLNTENFVHFFSTDDQKMADKWYDAVQQWRSWYLVHEMGEGGTAGPRPKTAARIPAVAPSPQTHRVKASVDENPYTIGTFSPLLDISRFDSASPNTDSDDENRSRQIPFHLRNSFIGSPPRKERERHPPPVTYSHRLPPMADDPINSDFAPSGLLGRSYSQRQRAQKEKEAAWQTANTCPFTGGLLNSTSTTIDNAGRPRTSAAEKNLIDTGRSMSMSRPRTAQKKPGQGQGKPLLDLPADVLESAPQWKSRRAHAVVPPSGVPLVEVANTPDGALLDYQKAQARVRMDGETREFVKGSLLERGGGNGGAEP